jgi:circadian clock protein KaiC
MAARDNIPTMMPLRRKRIKTYIEGFDKKLNGGLPHGSVVLLAGAPGTMKSSLAYSVLYNNAKRGIKGIYLLFGQNKSSLLEQLLEMGLGTECIPDRVNLIDFTVEHMVAGKEGMDLEFIKRSVDDAIKVDRYELLAVDHLEALMALTGIEGDRIGLFRLFSWLKGLGLTVLVLSEKQPEFSRGGRFEECYLADGLIHLVQIDIIGQATQRRIRCIKMRNTQHSTNYFNLIFADGRFMVNEIL